MLTVVTRIRVAAGTLLAEARGGEEGLTGD